MTFLLTPNGFRSIVKKVPRGLLDNKPNGMERVRNIDPLLVLPKNSRQRGAKEIGRFDSVSLSAGIQVTALIGRG